MVNHSPLFYFFRIYQGENKECTSMCCKPEKAEAFMSKLEEENKPYYAEKYSIVYGTYKPFKQFKGR